MMSTEQTLLLQLFKIAADRGSACIGEVSSFRSPSLYERQELLPHLFVFPERPEDGRRRHLGILLLDAAHHHAEVLRLYDDANSLGAGLRHNSLRDLLGHALLYLEPARVHVDYARKLRDAEYLALRNVADRALAVERKHMVLAERIELDVLQYHHVVRAGGEARPVHYLGDVLPVAPRKERKRLRHPLRRLHEPVARRVFAQQLYNAFEV